MTYYVNYTQDGNSNCVIAFPSPDNHLFVKKTNKRLFIHIPSKSNDIKELVLSIGYLRFLDGFFLKDWDCEDKIARLILFSMPLPIPVWFLIVNFLTTLIEISPNKFRIQYCLFNRSIMEVKGDTKAINKVELREFQVYEGENVQTQSYGIIWENIRTHKFGRFLEASENKWLVSEIESFLNQLRSTSEDELENKDEEGDLFEKLYVN